MSLQTPTTIRARQWKLISQGEDTSRAEVSSRDTSIKRPTIEGLAVKPIGKLSAGNRHARFDERGWETERWPSAPSYRAYPQLYQTPLPAEPLDPSAVRAEPDMWRCGQQREVLTQLGRSCPPAPSVTAVHMVCSRCSATLSRVRRVLPPLARLSACRQTAAGTGD